MNNIRESVLIVGDFSGVGINLLNELKSNGFKVRLITDGDGYKSINQANKFSWILKFPIGRYIFLILTAIRSILSKYNYVIFVTPYVLKGPAWLCGIANKLILKRAKKSVFLACGSDAIWWNYKNKNAERTAHNGFIKDLNGSPHRFSKKNYEIVNRNLADSVDKIIGLGFEYISCYEVAGYKIEYCGFPISQDFEAAELDFKLMKKKFCYHGITRPGFKGSEELINLMQANENWGYSELITEKISFSSFKKNLMQSAIYLDQWSSFGPAMAALEALKYCPVVITSFQPEFSNKRYVENCPVIDPVQASNNPDLVYELLSNHEAISKARKFLSEFHSPSLLVSSILK